MNKVLILGIGGFVGRHFQQFVTKNSLDKKYHFIGLDIQILQGAGIDCQRCDLLNEKELSLIIKKEKPKYIINLAGLFHSENINLVIDSNTKICRIICESVIENNIDVKKILLIGSAAEYGSSQDLPLAESAELKPVNMYGLSKVWQTSLAKYYRDNFNLRISIARPFNITSADMPSTLSIGSFINQINKCSSKGILEVGNIETKRDFIDIEDAIEAFWAIFINKDDDFIFNVCSGQSVLISEIIKHLIDVSQKEISILVDSERIKIHDIADSYGNSAKIENITGWSPKKNFLFCLDDAVKPEQSI